MTEEMASSPLLCFCVCVYVRVCWVCVFADHTLDYSGPCSMQREQIVPSFSSCCIPPLPRNIGRYKAL